MIQQVANGVKVIDANLNFPVNALEMKGEDLVEDWTQENPPPYWPRELVPYHRDHTTHVLCDIEESYRELEKLDQKTLKGRNREQRQYNKDQLMDYLWNINGRRTKLDYYMLLDIVRNDEFESEEDLEKAKKYIKLLKIFTDEEGPYFKFSDFKL